MTVINFGKQSEPERSKTKETLTAVGFIAAIVVGGALGWGLIGYLAESIYFSVALIIGVGLARVLTSALGQLNLFKGTAVLMASLFLTFITIALGEFLFTVIYIIFEMDCSIGEAIYLSKVNLGDIINSVDAVTGYVFGVIGVIIGLIIAIRENKRGAQR